LRRPDSRGQTPAVDLYGRLLATAAGAALSGGGAPQARVRGADGRLEALPLDLWLGPVTEADMAVVEAAVAPVLDVGCGPGRLLEALEASGKAALGVDLSPEAVRLSRQRGGQAIEGCVFTDAPDAGEWQTILLLDGNVGIGGDPEMLLARVAALLAPGGTAIVEVAGPGEPTRRTRIRIECPGVTSDWFPWAEVSSDGITLVAAAAGLHDQGRLARDGRVFAMLGRPA
jgi:SAM-dependent methyltransferase